MIQQRLERLLARRCTLLGVGPMSLNCVDVTIDLANEYNVPLMLIASRRQIDSEEFGGGYVNNWTTRQFADYVIDKDKQSKVILARDHGGPWQNPVEIEKGFSLRRAMESAKASYRADLDAGFQILHIDPSVDIFGKPDIDEVLDRVFELYEFCFSYAQSLNRKVLFEIGTEEQSGSTNKQEEMRYSLSEIKSFCKKNKMPQPLFIVVQTGAKVMETRNVGSFDSPIRVADEIPPEIQVPKMVELCNKFGIYMKAHNTDYLSDEALQWYPRLGIHSANVAPEFGLAETKALLDILEDNGLAGSAEAFLKVAFESGKWKKWMLHDTKASDRDRAMIAGHYVFTSPECISLKAEASEKLRRKGIDMDRFLRIQVRDSILRYLNNFRLVGAK
jgi:tagatose-1,6-bisphosphate aldolase non-catalytic subunit AgaZ/GatZ